MITTRSSFQRATRAVAVMALPAGVAACFALRSLVAHEHQIPIVFFLVVSVCGTLAVCVRGVGPGFGTWTGLLTGLAMSAGLARQYAPTPANQAAFVLLATTVLALIGNLAGNWTRSRQAPEDAADVLARPPAAPEAGRRRIRPAPPVDSVLHGLLADFSDWLASEEWERAAAEGQVWPAFDLFVRETLRRRLEAAGVRVFRVSVGGAVLQAMTRGEQRQDLPVEGVLAEAVQAGSARVCACAHAPRPGDDAAVFQHPQGRPAAWAWLLPLQSQGHAAALVTVGRLPHALQNDARLAAAVRECLQLFWVCLRDAETLRRCHCTDRQSGALNRTECLEQLRRIAEAAVGEREPVLVLALAVEGLRRLDDGGQWSLRDDLIERMGEVLRARLRSDDLIGRFSDDRFVLVLRGTEPELGRRIARKLLETLRRDVLAPFAGAAGADALRVRLGLAALAPRADSAAALLERSMRLLDEARRSGVDLAADGPARPARAGEAVTEAAATPARGGAA